MKILKATLSSKSREEVCRSENVPCCQEVLCEHCRKGLENNNLTEAFFDLLELPFLQVFIYTILSNIARIGKNYIFTMPLNMCYYFYTY